MAGARALILGAGGQDGPYLANYLHRLGYSVWGTTHPLEDQDVVSWRAPSMETVQTDVTDPISLQRTLEGTQPDEIYALAAVSAPSMAARHPVLTVQATTASVLYLLEWLKSHPTVSLFYASTAAIFGAGPPPQDENTPRAPNSLYGVAKLAAHELVRVYREREGLRCVNGILFNHESVWRPRLFVTRKITTAVASKQRLSLGNVVAVRDWGFAGDYIRAMHLLLQQGMLEDTVIGSGDGHTVEEFVQVAFAAAGLDYADYLDHDSALDQPTDRLVASRSRMAVLGWEPKVRFEELVRMMVAADQRRLAGISDQQLAEEERLLW